VLKNLRALAGEALRPVAARAGISHSYLEQLEKGEVSKPSREVLERLAEALGAPPRVLLASAGHTVEPEAPPSGKPLVSDPPWALRARYREAATALVALVRARGLPCVVLPEILIDADTTQAPLFLVGQSQRLERLAAIVLVESDLLIHASLRPGFALRALGMPVLLVDVGSAADHPAEVLDLIVDRVDADDLWADIRFDRPEPIIGAS
jgi:transcriptional regulator with XRE-family HTH domain